MGKVYIIDKCLLLHNQVFVIFGKLGVKYNLSASQKKKSVAPSDMPETIGFISGEDYLQLMIADRARIGIADLFGSTTYQSLYCGGTN